MCTGRVLYECSQILIRTPRVSNVTRSTTKLEYNINKKTILGMDARSLYATNSVSAFIPTVHSLHDYSINTSSAMANTGCHCRAATLLRRKIYILSALSLNFLRLSQPFQSPSTRSGGFLNHALADGSTFNSNGNLHLR